MTQAGTVELLERLTALGVRLRVEDGRLRVSAPKGSLTKELETAIVAHKPALLATLAGAASSARLPALVPVPRDGAPLRLSFLQERLWVLDQLHAGYTAYNLAVRSPTIGQTDLARLQEAIRRTVARHEILRARFVRDGGVPVVRLADAADTPIVVEDLRGLSADAVQDRLERAAPDATQRPFDLVNEAPVRFTVLQTDTDAAALVFSTHHIAMDSWSLGVLSAEVAEEYRRLEAGLDPRDPPALQYLDYAQWQRALVDGPGATRQLAYWTTRLAGLPQTSTFPTDRPRHPDAVGTGDAIGFRWPTALYDGVRTLARDNNATVYMVLLAAMAVALSRTAAQADLAIGSPIGTRDQAVLEGILGPIVNPLVLRFSLGDDPTFAEVIGMARDAVLDGHQHQDVPFEAIVQALNPERALNHSPLFQVAVVLHNAPEASATHIVGGGAIYDLTVFAVERDGEMTGLIEFRSDLYDVETVQRIDRLLQAVLAGAVASAGVRVSTAPLCSPADADALVAAVNPAPVAVDSGSAVEQFVRMARSRPDAIAVQSADVTMTYAELELRSAALARELTAAGAGPGTRVALATARDVGLVVGLLGILRSGAAYIPIDLSYPAERISFMMRDSGAQHVVTTATLFHEYSSLGTSAALVDLDAIGDGDREAGRPHGPSASDAAYVIYTSGSTGVPKGVQVSHAALSNFLGAMRREPGVTADDVVLSVTSLAFDISILEVLLPLVAGARTVIAGREVQSDGAALAALIDAAAPTIVQSTPSGWRLLMQTGWTGAHGMTAIVGGETMPPDLASWLLGRVGAVYNAYGPTETTVWSTLERLRPDEPITVGRPIANTRVHVLDSAGQVVPFGVPGEIWIGGAGVADGYHGRPELTAERFIADPFHPGERIYRTGDYGRWRVDGRLDHLGRADGQIKLRGFRIETGEIEAALMTHPDVSGAVVDVRAAAADDPRLVGWVRLIDDTDCTGSELRRHLRRSLPEFMVPSMILLVDEIPRTPNGKTDRAALPNPFAAAMSVPQEFIAPTTATERLIAGVWSTLLGVERVGTTDRFFDLGGHSLLAMQAAAEISAATGVRIEPRLLFFRTLADLAGLCETVSTSATVGHAS